MLSDLKFAVRKLRKSPGFSLAVILTLAIGIGANVAVFSMMDALVLRPLALPDMDRVVTLDESQNHADAQQASLGNYEDWARQARSFEGLAIRTDAYYDLTGAGEAAHVQAEQVSPNFFDLLQVQPLIGRTFTFDEAQPGRDAEAVLTYAFWKRQFGGDPNVISRRVELDGRAFTVIGVMPKTLTYPSAADLFVPLAPTPEQTQDRKERNYYVLARLKSGMTIHEAQAEMDGIVARLAKEYPSTDQGWGVVVSPLLKNINGDLTPMYMRMIMGATMFVLLIVCANVANLQFARGLGRRNEMAVRTALGAPQTRLMRQLLAESIFLGLIGAAGGLLFAKIDLRLVIDAMPARVERFVAGWSRISLNGRALALSIALAVAAGVISGVLPAIEVLRLNLVDQLKSGGRTATGSGRSHRLRNIFAVAQIALAVSLVIGAALMAKGTESLMHRSDIYHPGKVLTFSVHLPDERYGTPSQRSTWYADSVSRIESLPGVKTTALTTALPNGDEEWDDDFRIDGKPLNPGQVQTTSRVAVSAGFFKAFHIEAVEGRVFNSSDGMNTAPAAVVSENFAKQNFPGTNAIGHKIRMGVERNSKDPEVTIVGIVPDIQYLWINSAPEPTIYLNTAQIPPVGARYVVVANGDALSVAPDVRRALAAMDPALALDGVESYANYIHDTLVGLMYAAVMLAVDAGIALLLAGIGIFGVMANLVGERRREIGVRLTMGASREDVLRMVLRRAAILTGAGLAIGIPLAAGLARMVANLLFGVKPGDIAVFATTTIAIAGIALLAAYLPARRAAQVDPVESLRNE